MLHFLSYLIEIQLIYSISFRLTIQWFNIFIHYVPLKVIIKYWLYFLRCTIHSCSLLYMQWFVPLNFLHLTLPSFPLPTANQQFSVSVSLFLFYYIHSLGFFFFFFFRFPKWKRMVFVFLWLTSLSIIPSRSTHVVANGKILFFYGWIIFLCVCVCVCVYYTFFIHSFVELFLYVHYCK